MEESSPSIESTTLINNNKNNESTLSLENKKEENEERSIEDCKRSIGGVKKFMNNQKFEKLLKDLNVPYKKAKKTASIDFGVVWFHNKEEAEEWEKKLKETEYQGQLLTVKSSTGRKRPGEEQSENQSNRKREKKEKKESNETSDAITPWANVPYEDQLKQKEAELSIVMREIVKGIRKEAVNGIPGWVRKHEICELKGILRSPEEKGYRNKIEFTIGNDEKGVPCIGFSCGRMKDDVAKVGDPSSCMTLNEKSLAIRNLYQKYIENSDQNASYTTLKPYDKYAHQGFWRQMTVRVYPNSGQVMVAFQVSDKGLTQDQLNEEKNKLTKYTKEEVVEKDIQLNSLFIQIHNGISNFASSEIPFELLYGSEYVYEKLLGLDFRISPGAFFQVNSKGAEILYTLVKDWCLELVTEEEAKDSTILDLCCGTGTIGITMAKHVQSVVGIEMIAEAIEDAKHNANLNGIENCQYLVGKAEDVMRSTEGILRNKKCIAVVDPPRAGLHPTVVKAIRKCSEIEHLVFVSCDKRGLIDNALG
eukprot:TRINITY_DN3403_c0_g1_i3.p1 TRINITY_DN3403_c0_g1~~TRINITY_DN3403_c0_g1_i3.p1  ORF type:complete len:533 (-),score=179.09 TRINITY_DN3403_c0_g1_i3:264-1862(-)